MSKSLGRRPNVIRCGGRLKAIIENGTKGVFIMPRGDKSKYTEKQKRQAEHIEVGNEDQVRQAAESAASVRGRVFASSAAGR